MDNLAEHENRAEADRRRIALRAAQQSRSNVFLFRRLKWGPPKPAIGSRTSWKPRFGIVELLLGVIIVASLGVVVSTVWMT